MHTFTCDLCGQQEDHDPIKRHIPIKWYNRRIKGVVYLLCYGCGNDAHFHGGISPYLKELFKSRLGIDIDSEKF